MSTQDPTRGASLKRAARLATSAALCLAAASAPSVAWAQAEAITWHAPEGECPDEATVRTWVAEELARAPGVRSPRVVASVSHGASEWTAVVRRRRGGEIVTTELRDADCQSLAHTVAQEIVFDAAVLPDVPPPSRGSSAMRAAETALEAVPRPPRAARPPTPPRLWLDVGAGFGAAYIGSMPSIVEAFPSFDGSLCGDRRCPTSMDPGFASSTFLRLGLRARLDARFALGLDARLQLDAAPDVITYSTDGGLNSGSKSNTLGSLLLALALYWAPDGFRSNGFSWALFGGLGVGQIQPNLSVASGVTLHANSGFFALNLGLRAEYGFASNLHVAAELRANAMFPTTLFDLDASVSTGLHF